MTAGRADVLSGLDTFFIVGSDFKVTFERVSVNVTILLCTLIWCDLKCMRCVWGQCTWTQKHPAVLDVFFFLCLLVHHATKLLDVTRELTDSCLLTASACAGAEDALERAVPSE